MMSALAQAQSQDMTSPAPESLNRFGLSYRMMFNVTVDFKNAGAFSARSDPGPATGAGLNRSYDDGYNKVDVTGNNHGPGFANTTWFWGYDNNSQIQPSQANPQSVVMHSSSSSGRTVKGLDDNPEPGFELSYNRELLRHGSWRFGLEATFGYNNVSVKDSRPANIVISQITDTFTVPPEVSQQPLPPPGYRGSSQGAGPVIGSEPSRTTSSPEGTVSGARKFDADLFGLRIGPYVEFPLNRRVALALSGGLALAYVGSDLTFRETITMPQGPAAQMAGSGSHNDLLPGGYVAGNCTVTLSEKFGVFAGAQFQDVGQYTHRQSAQKAVLDLSQSVFVTVGFVYSF